MPKKYRYIEIIVISRIFYTEVWKSVTQEISFYYSRKKSLYRESTVPICLTGALNFPNIPISFGNILTFMFGIEWDNLPHPWGKLSQYLGVSVTKQKIMQWVNNELHFHHSISACQIPHAISQFFSNGIFFTMEN